MAGIFGGFNSLGNFAVIGKLILWIVVFGIVGIALAMIVVMVLVKKTQKEIIEIDMTSRRIRKFKARTKKTQGNIRQVWAAKIKRYLPNFQGKDIYSKGKQDVVILLKDNNGLYHTARVPTWKEMRKWYQVVYDIDINVDKNYEKVRNIYLLLSPHEDLDWLATQISEADKEFKIDHWWQSPTIAYIATGFICMIMFIMTIILSRKL